MTDYSGADPADDEHMMKNSMAELENMSDLYSLAEPAENMTEYSVAVALDFE